MVFKRFNLTVKEKIPPFVKTIKVDADKSMSIRSFLIGAVHIIYQKLTTF